MNYNQINFRKNFYRTLAINLTPINSIEYLHS